MNLTVLGFWLAIAGILITIAIAISQRRPKRVTYDILTNRQIIARTAYQATGALSITYGDKHLTDPHLVVIRIANDGKVAIGVDDWAEPLSLDSSSEIIDSGVVGTSPEDLKPEITIAESNRVCLSKILLNPGEWYDVQMLIDGSGSVSVSARIAGARLEARRDRVRASSIRTWLRSLSRLSPIWYYSLTMVIGVALFVVAGLFASHLFAVSLPSTRVPQLIGTPLNQVIPELHRANLHLGTERFVPSLGPVGIVIDQIPGAGYKEAAGGAVSVVISQRG